MSPSDFDYEVSSLLLNFRKELFLLFERVHRLRLRSRGGSNPVRFLLVLETLHGSGEVRGWWSRRLGFARGCFVFDPLDEKAAHGGRDQTLGSDPGSGFTDLRRPVYRGVKSTGGCWVCLGVSANRLLLLGIRRVSELFA
ncbi:hypothetical protein DY000_02041534 [Brassica cretica]|uniref:Uncharacterized protein n=1 Tax=Brassica cretica TaxID=69181 RepID=A0ABQ7B9U3_BRACR|nr:hypothetical protein DY000_02041534 [Brassica cretica]